MIIPRSLLTLVTVLTLTAAAQQPNEKAGKYLETLLRRPAPGAVFDRFYNAWLDTGTLEEMEQYLRTAAEAPEAGAEQRMVLAFFYARQSDHARAVEEFRRALEKSPGSADAWHQKALAEFRLLDLPAALASLDKALAAGPAKELALELQQLKGRVLARDGQTEAALKVWLELLASAPDDEALQEDVIDLQAAEGLHKEALATAQALLEKTADPYKKVQRRLRTGDLLARMGQRDAAVAAYALALDDTGTDSWLEKEILAQLELVYRREDAIDAFKTQLSALVEKYPQRLGLARRQARLMGESGDVDGAVAAFQKILVVSPGDRALREACIDLLAQHKRHAEAVAQLGELAKQHPADAALPARLAELHHAAGNAAAAEEAVALFLTKSDQSESAHLRAAALLERCGTAGAGLKMLEQTAAKFPDSEAAADALAVALHRAGRKEEAVAAWRRLATGADKLRLGNVARSAAARDENALAFELLSARAAEFQNDTVYLTQLCDAAARVEKFAEALPHAFRALSLTKDAVSLEPALITAVRFAEKAGKLDDIVKDLSAATTAPELALLAEIHEKAGRGKEAEATLEKITATAPEIATTMLVRLHSARGEQDAAASALQKLVEAPGGQKPAQVQRLVELLARAGKREAALRWVQTWKKVAPGATQPWLREAALQMERGQTAEALQVLRRAAAQFDSAPEVKLALAAACRDDGKLADAMRLFTALYEDAQDMAEKVRVVGELAKTAQQANSAEDLIESFQERRRNNRTSLAPLMSLAEIYRVLDNYEARRTTLLEAARVAPENRDIRMELARSAQREGDWDRAVQTLRDLSEGDTTGKSQVQLASALYEAGREEESLQLMTRLAAEGKVDARGAEDMAQSLAAVQAWQECATFLTPLLTKYPGDYRLAYFHAVALAETETPEAATALRRLMAMKEELPAAGNATAPGQSPGAGLQRLFRDPVLEAAPELVSYMRVLRTVETTLRKRHQSAMFATSGRPGRNTLTLPSSLEELQAMALAQMAALIDDAGSASRAEFIAAAESAGIPEPETLLEIAANTEASQPLNTLRKRFPESRMLLLTEAARIAYLFDMKNVNLEETAEVHQKIKATQPTLARILALYLAASDKPEHTSIAAAAGAAMLAEAEQTKTPPPVDRFLMAAGPQAAFDVSHVTPAMAALRDSMLEWLKRNDALLSPGLRDLVQRSSLALFIAKKDFTALTKALDEVMSAPPTAAAAQRAWPVSYNSNLLSELGFPPRNIRPAFIEYFDLSTPARPQQNAVPWPKEQLPALLQSAGNPLLRALLAYMSGDAMLLTQELEKLLRIEKPDAYSIHFAAGWLENQGRYEEAAAYYQKHLRPRTPQERQAVDGQIVYWAVEAMKRKEKLKEGAPLLQVARESALRLRPAAMVSDFNAETLISAMWELGMEQELARFQETRNLRTNQLATVTKPGRPQPVNQAKMLMESGKKEDAVRALVREFKSLAQSYLALDTSGQNEYVLAELRTRATKLDLLTPLLAALDPGTSSDVNAIATWGVAQEFLAGKAQAVEHYRRALERRPRNDAYFILWLRTALQANPRNTATILATLDPQQDGRVDATLRQNSSGTFPNTPERALVLEGLEKWIAGMDAARLRKAPLTSVMIAAISWQTPSNGNEVTRFGTLNWTASPAELKQKEEDRMVTKRWRESTEKLLRHLIRNETCSIQAFQSYAGLRLGHDPEKAPEELDQLAAELLQSLTVPGQPNTTLPVFYSFQGAQEITGTGVGPGEWMLRRAIAAKKPGEMTAVAARLTEAGLTAQAESLTAAVSLFTCSDAEFPALGKSLAERALTQKRAWLNGEDVAPFQLVMFAMHQRGLHADVAPVLLDMMGKSLNHQSEQVFNTLTEYLLHLKKTRGGPAAQEFLRKITELAFGPVEARAAHIAKEFKPGSWSSGTPNGRMHYWLEWLEKIARQPEIALLAALEYERGFLVFCADPVAAQRHQSFSVPQNEPGFYKKPPEEFMRGFRGTPLLAELAEFDLPTVPPGQSGERTLPATLFKAMSTDPKVREVFAAEPQTFGSAFMLGALNPLPVPELLTLLGQRREEIEKLPLPLQERLLTHYVNTVAVISKKADQDPTKDTELMAQGRAWIKGLRKRAAEQEIAKFMAAERASEMFPIDMNLGREVADTLPELLRTDPDKALAYFLHVRRMVAVDQKAETATVRASGSYRSDDPMHLSPSCLGAALLSALKTMEPQMKNGDSLIPRQVAAIAQMLADPEGAGVESSRALNEWLGWLVLKAGRPAEKDSRCQLPLLMERLGPLLKPEWMPVLFGALEHAMWHSEVRLRQDDQEWLRKQWKEQGAHREFAAALYSAALVAARQDSGIKEIKTVLTVPGGPDIEQEWALEQFRKKACPPAQMASFAASLIQGWQPLPAVRLAGVHALADSWTAGQAVTDDFSNAILEGLMALAKDHVFPDTEETKSAARAVSEAWLKFQTDPKKPRIPYGQQGATVSDGVLARRLLYIALGTGHTDTGLQMAKRVEEYYADYISPAWPGMLVFFRQPDAARAILQAGKKPGRSNGTRLYNNDAEDMQMRWDYKAGVHEGLPALLALYENPVERYRAEVILSSLSDFGPDGTDGALKDKVPNRKGRLLALAKAWPGDDVLKLNDGPELLAQLLSVPGGMEALTPLLEKLWTEKKLLSLLPDDNTRDESGALNRIASAVIGHRLQAGEVDALLDYCQTGLRLKGPSRDLPYYTGRAIGTAYLLAMPGLKPLWPKLDEAKRREIASIGREMLANQSLPGSVQGANPESYSLLYSHVWWMSLTEGHAGAFHQAVHVELQKEDSYLKHSLRQADETALLPQLLEPWGADAPDAVARRSENMMQWIMLGEALPGQGRDGHAWLKRVIKAGWLRPEDVLAKAGKFFSNNPLSAEVLPDLVSLALEAKDNDTLTTILTAAKATLSSELRNKEFLSAIDRLRAADRFQEALALVEFCQEGERRRARPPEQSAYTVRKLDLAFQKAGVAGGRDAVLKLAATHFSKNPGDKATWTALPWAFMHLSARAEKAGRKEEALDLLRWSTILSRAAVRHRLEYPGVGLPWANDQVKALIKSLAEEEKAFTAATAPDGDGAANLIRSAGPAGEALPEAVRLKLSTSPE